MKFRAKEAALKRQKEFKNVDKESPPPKKKCNDNNETESLHLSMNKVAQIRMEKRRGREGRRVKEEGKRRDDSQRCRKEAGSLESERTHLLGERHGPPRVFAVELLA